MLFNNNKNIEAAYTYVRAIEYFLMCEDFFLKNVKLPKLLKDNWFVDI